MSYSAFYREQAEQARGEAEAANLPNVKARYFMAARTWSEMANRAERVETIAHERNRAAGAGRVS